MKTKLDTGNSKNLRMMCVMRRFFLYDGFAHPVVAKDIAVLGDNLMGFQGHIATLQIVSWVMRFTLGKSSVVAFAISAATAQHLFSLIMMCTMVLLVLPMPSTTSSPR